MELAIVVAAVAIAYAIYMGLDAIAEAIKELKPEDPE